MSRQILQVVESPKAGSCYWLRIMLFGRNLDAEKEYRYNTACLIIYSVVRLWYRKTLITLWMNLKIYMQFNSRNILLMLFVSSGSSVLMAGEGKTRT